MKKLMGKYGGDVVFVTDGGEVVLLGRREPGSQVGVALKGGVSGWSAGSAP